MVQKDYLLGRKVDGGGGGYAVTQTVLFKAQALSISDFASLYASAVPPRSSTAKEMADKSSHCIAIKDNTVKTS